MSRNLWCYKVQRDISNFTLHPHLCCLPGASHYGVADIAILAAETHKFESRYVDLLIAPYNDENKKIYDARSPIQHIDKFNCPIAFFQGDEDEVRRQTQLSSGGRGISKTCMSS